MNFMAQVRCPKKGEADNVVWANSCTKDKTGQTVRCTHCGQVGHDKVRR